MVLNGEWIYVIQLRCKQFLTDQSITLTSHAWRSTQGLEHYQQNTTYTITISLKIIIKRDIIHSNMI